MRVMGLDSVISMAYLMANSMVYNLHNSTIFYINNLTHIIFSEFERWDSMDKANNMRWTTVWMPPGLFWLAHSGVIFQYDGGIHIIPAGEVMNTS